MGLAETRRYGTCKAGDRRSQLQESSRRWHPLGPEGEVALQLIPTSEVLKAVDAQP